MRADPKSGYTVGYGKPPLHTRFKPGNRANPRGRPRRSDGLALQLIAALDEAAEVEDADGKRRKIKAAPRPPSAVADRAVIANFIARLRRP